MNIELTDVARTFGRNKAVDGVSLAVGLGVFGLLGPNGAGKTSLLRMLATVLPPSSGTVRLLDRDPGKPAARTEIRRRLGYLPQNLGYYPSFTVAEFVEYFVLLKEMPAHQVPKVVAAAVERVDLDPRAKARLRTLSGGMLRRVGIAQAIVNDPDLLLLDEPTAGLDPEQRVAFRTLIRDLGQHATVVVSTHLVEDVGTACSEVALMAEGKVVFRGTPDELTAQGEGHQVGDSPLERGYSADWEQGEQQDFITWFVSGPVEQDSPGPTPAQEAVAIALLAKIGAPVPQYPQFSQPSKQSGTSSASGASGTQPEASAAQITAAATRLESLSPAARRAWLTANIAALRAGTATLAQVP